MGILVIALSKLSYSIATLDIIHLNFVGSYAGSVGFVIGAVAGAFAGWVIDEFGDVIIDWVVGWFDKSGGKI